MTNDDVVIMQFRQELSGLDFGSAAAAKGLTTGVNIVFVLCGLQGIWVV